MPTSLFEGATQDPRFPEQIVKAAEERNGLRHLLIGEDGNYIVVLGHPAVEKVVELVRREDEGLYDDDEINAKDLSFTWARMLTKCPDHDTEDEHMYCQYCQAGVSMENWWMDWGNGQDKPGYFPVVVWGTGA